MTPSDSKQDTSCRTHGSKQFWFLFTFWSDVSVRIYKRDDAASTWHCLKLWLNVKDSLMGVRVSTFCILVFMEDEMFVGETNWKDGAALLGYWAGNFTTRRTRLAPQSADTKQLRLTASIYKNNNVIVLFMFNCYSCMPFIRILQHDTPHNRQLISLFSWNIPCCTRFTEITVTDLHIDVANL